jgi:hypothetical protein
MKLFKAVNVWWEIAVGVSPAMLERDLKKRRAK